MCRRGSGIHVHRHHGKRLIDIAASLKRDLVLTGPDCLEDKQAVAAPLPWERYMPRGFADDDQPVPTSR
jgi:hypothetical protein